MMHSFYNCIAIVALVDISKMEPLTQNIWAELRFTNTNDVSKFEIG